VESLSKWLTEYGDVFGITAEPTQDTVDPAQAAAYKKMKSAVDNGLTPDSSDDMLKRFLIPTARKVGRSSTPIWVVILSERLNLKWHYQAVR